MKIMPFCKTYNRRKVLNFPGMEMNEGSIYAIIGANGSGKSTFAKILSGVISPDSRGSVCDAGNIGYMPQKSYAFRMSVKKNIMLCGDDREHAEKLMEDLKLKELSGKRADRLSGGETARMALARLMMKSYDLLILDEPCAALDMETTIAAEELIRNYVKDTNRKIILVTHSLQQARRLADHILFFKEGELVESGTAKELLDSPQEAETETFLKFYCG